MNIKFAYAVVEFRNNNQSVGHSANIISIYFCRCRSSAERSTPVLVLCAGYVCGQKHQHHLLYGNPYIATRTMPLPITEYPNYLTATILEWKKLLKPNKYKDIIISSLRFLVNDNRAKIFSFAIMDNHIH